MCGETRSGAGILEEDRQQGRKAGSREHDSREALSSGEDGSGRARRETAGEQIARKVSTVVDAKPAGLDWRFQISAFCIGMDEIMRRGVWVERA